MTTREIRAIVQGLENITERVVQKITLDLTANLKEATPVDTGWARANWIPRIGVPERQPAPATGSVVAQLSEQAVAEASVFSYRLPSGAVFVSNNVPYILRLNDGSSTQAPSGFVQRAIAKAVTTDLRGLNAT